jgi:hypothetical protein
MLRLAQVAALALAAAAPAAALVHARLETRVVPPLAAPGVEPGVGRCTSDRVCTVTDDLGQTRPGTPVALGR